MHTKAENRQWTSAFNLVSMKLAQPHKFHLHWLSFATEMLVAAAVSAIALGYLFIFLQLGYTA